MGDVVRLPSALPPAEPPVVDPLWREVVGDVLRRVRTQRDTRLREVAERSGVSIQYLSEVERGLKEPSSEILAAVAGAMDLTLLDLTAAVSRQLAADRPRVAGPRALAV